MEQPAAEIRQNDRALVVGKTGTGKTTLALRLFASFISQECECVVIDPKRDSQLRQQFAGREGVHYLAPAPVNVKQSDFSELNRIFRKVYHHGRTMLYIDEAAMIGTASRWPQWLQNIYQQGRSRGLGVIACSQRPKRVPTFLLDQSEHVFSFLLKRKADAKTVAAAAGHDIEAGIRQLPPYYFYYCTDRSTEAIRCQPIQL